jgi:hypothetical protein
LAVEARDRAGGPLATTGATRVTGALGAARPGTGVAAARRAPGTTGAASGAGRCAAGAGLGSGASACGCCAPAAVAHATVVRPVARPVLHSAHLRLALTASLLSTGSGRPYAGRHRQVNGGRSPAAAAAGDPTASLLHR